MTKNNKLIIVESPTKAKTISSFLKGFDILPSYGHIRDLPKNKLGIDLDNFKVEYVIIPKAKENLKKIEKQARKSTEIILATDEDREGEAIAWHLLQALNLDENKTKRIVFHEITKPAIEEALKNPRKIKIELINAQQARRVLDRLVGYKLSPFLWRKIKYGLSAGRVQSAALRLICEKEKEIEDFISQEYWTISAILEKNNQTFEAQLFKINDKTLDKLEIKNEKEAKEISQKIKQADFSVFDLKQKTIFNSPLPPFTTSTLQQESWQKLRFSSKQTMMLAQQLYEQGLITYMRTDSVNISKQALIMVRKFIEQEFGKDYLPSTYNIYKTKSKLSQEAHEAIRPTDINKTSLKLKDKLTGQQLKLYELIWKRFVACQMSKATLKQTTVIVKAQNKDDYFLKATGEIIVFDGFLKIFPKKQETILPSLEKDDKLKLLEIKTLQHFTQPPARYNDASLVKKLEELGIGRPSTYASIISTLLLRNYIERNSSRAFTPTMLGKLVNDLLVKHFKDIVDYEFTATIENDLDRIAQGEKNWQEVVKNFYEPFNKNLEQKEKEVSRREATEKESEEICEKCGSKMVIKYGKYGPFLACSNYPNCSNIKKIPKQSTELEIPCPKCGKTEGGKIVVRKTKTKKRTFYGCSRWPKCDFMSWKLPDQ